MDAAEPRVCETEHGCDLAARGLSVREMATWRGGRGEGGADSPLELEVALCVRDVSRGVVGEPVQCIVQVLARAE